MELGGTVLAVHAHPDDESITTGGLLAKCSGSGIRTIVVTCTGGDIGPRREPVEGELAEVRSAELRAALDILGVSRGVQLGYRDSGLAGWPDNDHPDSFHAAPLSSAAERVGALLVEEQPRLIVTYGPDGGYGHLDHVKAHQVTVEAFRLAGLSDSRLYAVVFPRSWLRRFVELARAAGIGAAPPALLGVDDMDAPEGFGTPDDAPFETLDVGPYVQTKRAAIAAHRSQMGQDHVLMRLPPEVYSAVWSREHYLRLLP